MKTKEQILNYVQGTKQLLQEHNLLGEAYEDGWVVDFIEDIRDWIENRPKYTIVSDDSCHEYRIPADKRKEWDEWCYSENDDDENYNQDTPDYAKNIDGENLEFYLE